MPARHLAQVASQQVSYTTRPITLLEVHPPCPPDHTRASMPCTKRCHPEARRPRDLLLIGSLSSPVFPARVPPACLDYACSHPSSGCVIFPRRPRMTSTAPTSSVSADMPVVGSISGTGADVAVSVIRPSPTAAGVTILVDWNLSARQALQHGTATNSVEFVQVLRRPIETTGILVNWLCVRHWVTFI